MTTDRDKEFFFAVSKLIAFIEEKKVYVLAEFESGGKELISLSENVFKVMVDHNTHAYAEMEKK